MPRWSRSMLRAGTAQPAARQAIDSAKAKRFIDRLPRQQLSGRQSAGALICPLFKLAEVETVTWRNTLPIGVADQAMPRDVEGPIAKTILHNDELLAPRYIVVDKIVGQLEPHNVSSYRVESWVDDATPRPLTRAQALLGECSRLAARLGPFAKFTWWYSQRFEFANNAVGRLVSGIPVFDPHLERLSYNGFSQ